MEWAEYLVKGVSISTTFKSEENHEIVIDIQDNGAACKAALEKHLKDSEQEWSMLLEVCLKFQLRNNKRTAGLKNLQTNLVRLLEKQQVERAEAVMVSILEGSLYYMRAVLVNSETFIGYPIEMLEEVISRIAVVLLEMKKGYLEEWYLIIINK
jgi:hypothetical protein